MLVDVGTRVRYRAISSPFVDGPRVNLPDYHA